MTKEEGTRYESAAAETDRSAAGFPQRLRRGEAGAVLEARRRVVKILSQRVLAIPPGEREDLEQEIMSEIWQAVNRPGFDLSGGVWGFIEVVTARRCIDWLRARRHGTPIPEDLPSTDPHPLRQTLRRERAELASEVLSSLNTGCRDLVLMRLRDGLSYRDIGRITGKSEGALRVSFHRCIASARSAMKRFLQQSKSSSKQEEERP